MKIFGRIRTLWEQWVWDHTPHCRELCQLASQSLETPLPLRTRLRIRLHFLICVYCARYYRHLRMLRERSRASHGRAENSSLPGLSPAARRRIKVRLLRESER